MSRAQWVGVLVASFLGGFVGAQLLQPPAAHADGRGRVLQADQLWIYSPDGKHKVQLGTYPRGGEKGQPLLGFTDSAGKLKLLFRLHGARESAVVVMKDDAGRDRMVLGLQGAGDQAPFVACYDAGGRPTMLHGRR